MLSLYESISRKDPDIRSQRSGFLRYGIATIAVLLALGITWLVPEVRNHAPFMLFFLAVTFSALYGGFRAGVLATLLSLTVVSLWVMPPVGVASLTPTQLVLVSGFLVVSILISWVVYTVDQARTNLYTQNESLRVTLASIGDGVIASDLLGKIVWMNETASTLTGWRVDEAVGVPVRQVFNIVNEETRLSVENPVERLLAEGQVVGLANHTLLIAKNGVERPIENSAAPIKNVQGRVNGVVVIFHDISERRKHEQEAQTIQDRLHMALNAGRMVAWEWNAQRDQIWTTDTFAEIYGISAIEQVANGMQLVHPDDLARHQATVMDAAAKGTGYHSEFRIIRPDDGRIVWMEERASPMLDQAGKTERLVGIAVDITSHKDAEEEIHRLNRELAQRVQELQALFDLALVGIAVTYDPTCQVITVNQMLAQWLGMPKGIVTANNTLESDDASYRILHDGQELSLDLLPMRRAMAEKKSIIDQEVDIVRNDGHKTTVAVSVTPLYGEDGGVAGAIATYADITERKAMEDTLQHLNETLEQRVAERTTELVQLNRELVEFTSVISHDLKSPLRAISALSNWIGEEAGDILPPRSKEHLVKMRQRIQRMETMLSDLVAYTRAGRVRYKTERVNIKTLVSDITSALDAPDDFTATIVEPMPTFVTERVPLETVLRNLIGNAAKHHQMPEQGHVTISASDSGERVEFTISDDGPGIAEEYHERIFDVFQTLRPRDEVEGSGMGLAIVKRLVEGRDGRIRIQSQPGHGSTFYFDWPKQSV